MGLSDMMVMMIITILGRGAALARVAAGPMASGIGTENWCMGR
jgi:hypothetical protein